MSRRGRNVLLAILAAALSALLYGLVSCARKDGAARSPATSETLPSTAQSPVPAGVFALTQAGVPIPDWILSHPQVTGVVVRGEWPKVEPSDGKYDFSYFDAQLDRIAKAGKVASLVITSGGRATPQWLFGKGIQVFHFTDENAFHDTFGKSVEIPVFWDPGLLDYKARLIAQMGVHFAKHPALKLVSAQCANATTDDWNVPGSPDSVEEWKRVGFAEDKMVSACNDIVDATMAAFPNQLVKMAVGAIPRTLAQYPDGVVREIAHYASARYPQRFVVQRHNLAAVTPLPAESRQLFGWDVILEASPRAAAQFLWPASDAETCRLNKGAMPCDPVDTFHRAAVAALAYGVSYVEVYVADLQNPLLKAEVERLAHALREPHRASTPRVADSEIPRPSTSDDPGPSQERLLRGPGPSGELAKSEIVHETFTGKTTGKPVSFSVYLPHEYTSGDKRYPIIYWLHGKGGDEQRSTHVASYLKAAIAEGKIPPAIMVFPNGGRESFYSNSFDGAWPIETMIVDELVPYVDAHYRTIANRHNRLLMGFSMGGFGVLKFAAKFPERFAAVVAYAAPRTDESFGLHGQDAATLRDVFGNDEEKFAENTPSRLFRMNKAKVLQQGLRIRLVAGADDGTRHSVQKLHEVLAELGIPHGYEVLPGVRHVVGEYYDADHGAGFAFLAAALSQK